jgi:hypothetical protein
MILLDEYVDALETLRRHADGFGFSEGQIGLGDESAGRYDDGKQQYT